MIRKRFAWCSNGEETLWFNGEVKTKIKIWCDREYLKQLRLISSWAILFIFQDISIFRVNFCRIPAGRSRGGFTGTESADSRWLGDVKIAVQHYLNHRKFPEAELHRISPRSPDLNSIENVLNLLKKHLQEQAIQLRIERETFDCEEFSTMLPIVGLIYNTHHNTPCIFSKYINKYFIKKKVYMWML